MKSRCYKFPHSADEETRAKRGWVAHWRPYSLHMAELEFTVWLQTLFYLGWCIWRSKNLKKLGEFLLLCKDWLVHETCSVGCKLAYRVLCKWALPAFPQGLAQALFLFCFASELLLSKEGKVPLDCAVTYLMHISIIPFTRLLWN